MDLVDWLRKLSNGVRDDLTDATPEWIPILRTWNFTDEQWEELKTETIKHHGFGPLRFLELVDNRSRLLETIRQRKDKAANDEIFRVQ